MTETTSPALRTALAYYHAWTGHDLDTAMSYIADDIVCDAPAGRLEGAGAYRGKLTGQGAQLVEVLPADEYAHLPGAVSMPLKKLDSTMEQLDRTRPVIVYCHDSL
ncbi:MAG: nuclear transport factor 2 family protein [Streptosporangiaceae bacterium]